MTGCDGHSGGPGPARSRVGVCGGPDPARAVSLTDVSTLNDLPAPSGEQWTIAAHGYEATVVEVGGGLRHLTHDERDLVFGYAVEAMADAARGHVLTPWPNRIDGGRYSFDGEDYLLAHTEPGLANASHGLVQWLAWDLVERSTHRLTVGVTLHPQPGWAWTLRVEMTYSLDPDGLTVTPNVTNLSSTACPFGFGAHPYLTAGESSLDDAALTLDVTTQLTVDERLIPTGRETSTHDFSGGLPLEGVSLDTCFTDIGVTDGRWRASVTSGSRTTTLWADASAYRYVQTFTGDGLPEPKNRRSGLAVEPMTCPANAFNTGEGLLTLAPGETWSAPFGITGA